MGQPKNSGGGALCAWIPPPSERSVSLHARSSGHRKWRGGWRCRTRMLSTECMYVFAVYRSLSRRAAYSNVELMVGDLRALFVCACWVSAEVEEGRSKTHLTHLLLLKYVECVESMIISLVLLQLYLLVLTRKLQIHNLQLKSQLPETCTLPIHE